MKEQLKQITAQTIQWLQAAATKSKTFFVSVTQRSAIVFAKITHTVKLIATAMKYVYHTTKKIVLIIWKFIYWLYDSIAAIFRKVPAELTYWHDGVQNMVQVDDFVELAPNMIQYEDSDSKKRVKVKAEYPIKYILKEK
jgi:hypothetical protein